MPLRTPEKKSPLSGEGREVLSSSAAESEGIENFDSSEPVGRRVSLSDMISHAGGDRNGDLRESLEDIASSDLHISSRGGGNEELTTEAALSRLKTCCGRMFGEISSSKVSSVIESPFLGDAGGGGVE